MSRKTNQKAVIYCRVSTKKQAREGNGLESQETRCREYAKYRGHEVVRVFSDDMSGSLLGRPGMLEMLAFLRKHRREGVVVIIDDISRLARGIEAHLKLRAEISGAGGFLESPSIEFGTDSDSQLVEHLLASVSQHQRQKNGEQAKNRMRARMMNGYWVHNAPLGYRYQKSAAGGSVLVRDEPIASIIAEGLEGYASGRFTTRAEVKRFLEAHPGFPVCRHGFLTNEQAHRILTRPIYAGYIESEVWGISLRKAQHEPLISLETFQRIQERLNGKPFAPVRADINEDFPLRGVVTCGCCNHPLTANWSKGRSASYPYYVCRHRGCDKFGKSVARAKIDDHFVNLLQVITPASERVERLEAQLRLEWQQRNSRETQARDDMKQQIKVIEGKIAALLDRIMVSDSPTVISAYERKVEQLERDKLVLQEKTARCGTALGSFDGTFRTALNFLAKPYDYWEKGTLESRRTVLKLALASPLQWDWNEGVRTAELSLPFKVLNTKKDWENEMAERVGFEPTIGF